MISRKISIYVATLLVTLLSTQFATANVSNHVMPAQKSLVIIDFGEGRDYTVKVVVRDLATGQETMIKGEGISK